jgi:hypothetical protein
MNMFLCFHAFMRTTLDLPDATLRRAKIVAVERGTTLRQLVSEALAKELRLEAPVAVKRKRFPIFSSGELGQLSEDAVRQAELDEDLKQDGLTR